MTAQLDVPTTPATGTAAVPVFVVGRMDRGKRSNQEDSIWPAPSREGTLATGTVLLIVADGAGGHKGGEQASQLAVRTLHHSYAARLAEGHPPAAALRQAVVEANAAIRLYQQQHPEVHDMASTVVALALAGGSLWGANVGDSRAYLLRGTTLTQLSTDHTMVAMQRKLNHLTEEQARNHPLRHRLAFALGSHDTLPSIAEWGTHDLRAGDRYLLCSDGLTDVLSERELAKSLSLAKPLTEVAERLLAQAKPRADDNTSFLLLEIAPASPAGVPLAPSPTRLSLWLIRLGIGLILGIFLLFLAGIIRGMESNSSATIPSPPPASTPEQVVVGAPPPTTAATTPAGTPTDSPLVVKTALAGVGTTPIPSAIPTVATLVVATELAGVAATRTPTPIPSPTPRPRIVEYRIEADGVVFESVTGVGGGGRGCDGLSEWPLSPKELPYATSTTLASKPEVWSEKGDIYVRFDADVEEETKCTMWWESDDVDLEDGIWVIEDAILVEPEVSPDGEGGWLIHVEWCDHHKDGCR